MKNKKDMIILISIFAVLVILLVIAVVPFNKEDDTTFSGQSRVTEVSQANFEQEINTEQKVMIDFYATWCGPCKKLSPIIDEVSSEMVNVKFIRIDVDKNEELANKYEITAMPTLVVLEKGEVVARSVGLISKQKVVDLLK